MRKLYTKISKLFIGDLMFYNAMTYETIQLPFLPEEHPSWQLLLRNFTLIDDFNDDQLIDSYKNFH